MICPDCLSDTGSETLAKHATPAECILSWRAIAGYAMVASMATKKKIQRCRALGHPKRKSFTIQVNLLDGEKVDLELCFRCAVDGFVGHYVTTKVFEVLENRGTKFEQADPKWRPTDVIEGPPTPPDREVPT